MPKLDPALAAELLRKVPKPPVFPGVKAEGTTTVFEQTACQLCGGVHTRNCPRVRRIVYGDGGKPSEVEFWRHGEWPADQVLWLEDVQEAAAQDVSGNDSTGG